MCAALPRLNSSSQQPDGDEQLKQLAPQSPWNTHGGLKRPDPSGVFTPPDPSAMTAGGIFAIPTGPSPNEIPGFPAPPGSFPTRQNPAQPGQAAHSQRNGGIQPLSGMSIPATGPFSGPQQPISPLPTGGNGAHAAAPVMAPPQPQMPSQPQMMPPGPGSQINTGRLNPNMLPGVSTDQLSTGALDNYEAWFPEPRSIAECGLNQGLITDLVIKAMYFQSYMSGQDLSAAVRLPFYGILDQITNLMKREQLCDVSGASGLGEAGYQYVLTAKGMERAHQVLARSSYVGPAPVPLARYLEVVRMESSHRPPINRTTVERALKGMILSDELVIQVGAAVNAGKSLFLFGAPGNGKTLLAEKIATMLGGSIAIPYALEADGQVIQLFDLNSHRPAVPRGANETDSTKAELHDRRWVRVHRPVVIVGGELSMDSLDLVYNETAGFYEAPFQLKANGGLFLIDDFGRQQMSPQALLNRWIVPLEKNIDYLTLKTGKKLQVPFELFLVLSTNLQPEDLVDDAFLRRIQNKLFVPDPTAQQYFEIFVAQCKAMNIPYDQQGFAHLVGKHYREAGRPFRAAQPRDLLRQLTGLARYLNVQPELTPRLLDAACGTYFVNAKK